MESSRFRMVVNWSCLSIPTTRTRRENGRNKLIARPPIMRREKGAGISVSGLTRPLFPPAISFFTRGQCDQSGCGEFHSRSFDVRRQTKKFSKSLSKD